VIAALALRSPHPSPHPALVLVPSVCYTISSAYRRSSKEPRIGTGNEPESLLGQVVRESRGHYYVRAAGETYICSIRSKLRKRLVYPESDSGLRGATSVKSVRDLNPVAVGDLVRITVGEGGKGAIDERLPRKNVLARRASGQRPLRQVVVANADQLLTVFSVLQPDFEPKLADRLLTSAEHADLPAVICINKTDLVAEFDFRRIGDVYEAAGYRVLYTSALDGTGLDGLRSALQAKLTVLAGPSGAGKSSLLNRIQPGLGLKIKQVSAVAGEGTHATTASQMFDLDIGGSVVDTPGIRYLDPWQIPQDELPELFPEMHPYIGRCRFTSCAHVEEPGCAIRRAVEDGSIPSSRYGSYRELRIELRDAEKRARYSSGS